MKIVLKKESEMLDLAKTVFDIVVQNKKDKMKSGDNSAVVVALSGDLGSGKTTFTKYFAKLIGITETITSPTFIIQKRFKVPTDIKTSIDFENFFHLDVYRLDSAKELDSLRFSEILNSADSNKNLIFIEWAEKVSEKLPKKYIKMNFTFIDDVTREIEIE